MPRTPWPQSNLLNLAAFVAALILAITTPLFAGEGVINVNQHLTDDAAGNCVTPTNCDGSSQWVALPLDPLGQSTHLAGNAYHVGTQCQVAQARCVYNPHFKTKILSSDAGGLNPTTVQTWIGHIRQSPHLVGQIHFEHYDACLEQWADQGNAVVTLPNGSLNLPTSEFCTSETGYSTTPLEMLEWIRDHSGASVADTMLLQNGYLHAATVSTRRLRWKVWDPTVPPIGAFTDNYKRLVGSGYMGALAAPPERLNIPVYFKVLRAHNSHLIRVWAVEQWVAQAPAATKGASPFKGTLQASNYDLGTPNPAFYHRLRNFVQQAADRGIVVQLSLFDKHGIICQNPQNRPHQYFESPYRDANNVPEIEFMPDATCVCTHGFGPAPAAPEVVDCQPVYGFVLDYEPEPPDPIGTYYPELQAFHIDYLHRVGEEVGGIGNMIFEIINEALAPHVAPRSTPGDWAADYPGLGYSHNQQWQMRMAKQMRLSLPLANGTNQLNVVRDAFNGDGDGTPVANKVSDIEGAPWAASTTNVQVKLPDTGGTETGGLGPPRTLGYATSNAETGKSIMSAIIPFSSTSTWTKAQVRGNLTVISGEAKIGFLAGTNSLGVRLDTRLGSNQLRVEQIGGCPILAQMCTLGTATIASATAAHNIRLKVEQDPSPGTWHVSVFLDGAPVSGLQNLATSSIGTITNAFFSGTSGSTPYPVDDAKIDNFEAARFCDDESRGCVP